MRLTEFSSSSTQWRKHNKFPAQNGTHFHRTNQPETCHTRYDDMGIAILSWPDLTLTYVGHVVQNSVAKLWSSKGYDVVEVGSNSCSVALMERQLRSPNTYAFSVIAHGDLTIRGSIIPSVGGSFLNPQRYTTFGIAEMRLYTCFSAWDVPAAPTNPLSSPIQQWLGNVSKAGWFEGWSGEIGALQIKFGWGEVHEHGTW